MLRYQLIVLSVLMIISISSQFKIDDNYIFKIDDEGNEVDIISDTIRLLEDGLEQLIYSNNTDNLFLLGTTGTGKTTIALILTGDNSKLMSVDVGEEINETLGQYFIRDDGNLIGNSTITSKTILPQLFIDENTTDCYYDCPGYDDTRNASVDITATFLIKDIVDYAERVKFVFVLNHDSVQIGGSRTAFLSLTEHISRFMKDINKYKNGIAAIINNVNQPQTTTENVILTVARFLKQSKDELERKINEIPYYKDAIAFIDILLHETNGKYDRIQILRSPDRPGPVSEIPPIQDCRTALHKMIYNNLIYVEKDDDDFGYTISDKSQNDVYMLSVGLSKQISEDVKAIDSIIFDVFNKKEANESLDMYELKNMFDDSYKSIEVFIKDAKYYDTVEKFMNEMNILMKKINVPVPSDILEDFNTHIYFFNFLQTVSINTISVDSVQWASNLEGSNTYLETLTKFYSFLPRIYADFITYDYQENRELYNVSDLNDWGLPGKPQGIRIKSDADWNLFINKTGYVEMRNTKLNDIEFERLNTVLEWTLRSAVIADCNTASSTLKIKGQVVKLSDVTSARCYATSKYIRVYAIISIIFNDAIEKTNKQVHLSILAPTWNILTKTNNIILSGSVGKTVTVPARDGTYRHPMGYEGVPGGPGGASGHFFGIGSEFVNGKDLKIKLNGGTAGNGQDGGAGYTADIVEPPNGSFKDIKCEDAMSSLNYFKYGLIEFEDTKDTYVRIQKYKLYGDCAGNGGDPGTGGISGKRGTIDIISLYEDSGIQNETVIAYSGICGEPGKSGISTVTTTKCVLRQAKNSITFYVTFEDTTYDSKERHKYCKETGPGIYCNGVCGYISYIPEELLDRKTPVEEFRIYIESNANGLRKQTLKSFLERFNERTSHIE